MKRSEVLEILPYICLLVLILILILISGVQLYSADYVESADAYELVHLHDGYYWTFIDSETESEIIVYAYYTNRGVPEEHAVFARYCEIESIGGSHGYVVIRHYRTQPDHYIFKIPGG